LDLGFMAEEGARGWACAGRREDARGNFEFRLSFLFSLFSVLPVWFGGIDGEGSTAACEWARAGSNWALASFDCSAFD
jgi:hypothetical protein